MGDAAAAGELSTLAHAIRVLNSYSVDEPVLGTSELARRLGLSKSSTHRLVATLARHGLLKRAADGRYRLGLRLFELASQIPASLELREVALPYLRQLSHEVQETVHLAVRDGTEMVYLEKLEPSRGIRMYSRVGRRAPLHCTGVGKVVLAHEPEEVLDQVLAAGLPRFTPRTLADEAALRAELGRVRDQGFAWDLEEIEEGLRCVALPIRDLRGQVAAGISVAGPVQRMSQERLRQLVPRVRETAARISADLGYRPPRGG